MRTFAIVALLAIGGLGLVACGGDSGGGDSGGGVTATAVDIVGTWKVDEPKLGPELDRKLSESSEEEQAMMKGMLPMMKKGMATLTVVVKADGTYEETMLNPMSGKSEPDTGTWSKNGNGWVFKEDGEGSKPFNVTMEDGQLTGSKDDFTVFFNRQ